MSSKSAISREDIRNKNIQRNNEFLINLLGVPVLNKTTDGSDVSVQDTKKSQSHQSSKPKSTPYFPFCYEKYNEYHVMKEMKTKFFERNQSIGFLSRYIDPVGCLRFSVADCRCEHVYNHVL